VPRGLGGQYAYERQRETESADTMRGFLPLQCCFVVLRLMCIVCRERSVAEARGFARLLFSRLLGLLGLVLSCVAEAIGCWTR
jgi:hypothetical protein